MLRKAEKQGSERQGQKMEENFPAMLQCGQREAHETLELPGESFLAAGSQ
jgi:hypothetical protein